VNSVARDIVENVDADLFEHLPVMLVVTRPRGGDGEPVVEDCNGQFLHRLGYDRDDVVGRPVADFYTPESAARLRDDAYERARRGEFERAERELVTADGTLRYAVVRAVPRGDRPDAGVAAMYVDVTARKRREEHVQVLNRLMRHNIRNDLNVIEGHARMLAGSDDQQVVESARVIGRTVQRWQEFAEKAQKIDHLFEKPLDRRVPLTEVLKQVQTTVELTYPDGEVAVEANVPSDLSVPTRLRSAVEELCENGLKHAETDSPTVTVTADVDEDGLLAVAVADDGPGIPEHERAILQEGEETPLVHGSGLGFWLVRMVARHGGGYVSVRDRPESGSVVTVHVPLVGDETTE
jgi:PAS domain S-box-containing protein